MNEIIEDIISKSAEKVKPDAIDEEEKEVEVFSLGSKSHSSSLLSSHTPELPITLTNKYVIKASSEQALESIFINGILIP